jgi:hypothetical protein
MSDPVKPARPPGAPFDSQFAKEESHVRSRGREEDADTTKLRETVAGRTTRIDQKITRATLVLERLAPMDSRARLLGSAILRRDEVLLDAVLAEMTDELVSLSSAPRRTPMHRR